MVFSYLPSDWEAWELDTDIRDSLHPLTKSEPIDVTLTTAGTAEDLFNVSTLRPSINKVTNPSFETGDPPTGFTLSGSSISQSSTVARSGTYSILVDPTNSAAGEGFYWTTPTMGQHPNERKYLVASVYLQDNAGSSDVARIVIADSSGVTIANGNTITLSAAWQRSTAFIDLKDRTSAAYRIYVVTALQHNTNFYADDIQVEILGQTVATAYIDGAQGVNYEWAGTAHASESRRRMGLVQIRGYRFHTSTDIYFAEDQTASSTTGEFIRSGTDFWADDIIIESRLSFVNVNVGELPRITGKVFGVHYGKK